MSGTTATPLLSVWSTRSHVTVVYYVCRKRLAGGVDRVAAPPVVDRTTHIRLSRREPRVSPLVHSYVTFEKTEVLPLQYFVISVGRYKLRALVDSGSNFTLFGQEGIRVVRELGLPLIRGRGVEIRTAGGSVELISEEVELTFQL